MTISSAETTTRNQSKELSTSRDNCESVSNGNVITQPDIIVGTKRVSFHHEVSLKSPQNTDLNYNKNRINNKTAYFRLHRHSFTPGCNNTVDKLKEKYENIALKSRSNLEHTIQNDTGLAKNTETKTSSTENKLGSIDSANQSGNKLTTDALDKLRQKYSPKSFGYPKTKLALPSKIPVPTPRTTLAKQEAKCEPVKVKVAEIDTKDNLQVPVITEITPSNFEEVQLIYSDIKFAEPEDKHFIVTRSSSEDSVFKVQNSLADFIMDKKQKEKKRTSSFRRILTGGLFGRDKKKQEGDKSKSKKKDNAVFSDNAQNESQVFDRYTSHRHTVDSSYSRHGLQRNNTSQHHNNSGPLYYYNPQQQSLNTTSNRKADSRYTEMKGNSMVQLKHQLANLSHEDYVQMDSSRQNNYLNVNKFIDTSSSSSNADSDSRNETYQNALIAQAELRHIREDEKRKKSLQPNIIQVTNSDSSCSSEVFRSSPPMNQKSVELVKPKALIPINSERALPNPYHNIKDNGESCGTATNKTTESTADVDNIKLSFHKNNLYEGRVKSPVNTVVLEDTYGTVFDSINSVQELKCDTKSNSSSSVSQISPRSLEASKLKLPSNREQVELQPRIRSPLPQTKVSTDKIIATELLRNRGSPSRSPISSIERKRTPRSSRNTYENHEILPNAHSTPRSISNEYIHLNTATSLVAAKPPLSPRDNVRASQLPSSQKDLQHITLATVHSDASSRSGSTWQSNRLASPLYLQENATYVPVNANKDVHTYQNQANTVGRFYDAVDSHSSHVHSGIGDLYEKRTGYLGQQSPTHNLRQGSVPSSIITGSLYSNRDVLQEKAYSLQAAHGAQYNQQPQKRFSFNSDSSYGTVQNSVRPNTPVGQNVVSMHHQRSPVKQHMIENVEAFYWRELKRLKEKEEQDLYNYRQQQFYIYGYAEEPVPFRRSRSVSPTMQRGRRSLSLPREGRPSHLRSGPEMIPEGRPVIDKRPIALHNDSSEFDYGQIRQNFQRNPNFVRNTFERTTIGPIGSNRYYQNSEQPKQQNCPPIFKRGSLTSAADVNPDLYYQMNKKVSFLSSAKPNNVSWPTKNGYSQSPTRRNEQESPLEDDVFTPNISQAVQKRHMENIYMNDFDPTLSKVKTPLANQERSQLIEPSYGSAFTKHVTVSNKVCDMYGQIHNSKQPYGGQSVQLPLQNYGQVRQVGFVYGQVQQNPNQQNSIVMRQSFDHLTQPNFVRGTRLTASVNDMHRRYPMNNMNHVEFVRTPLHAPNRPLPPVPERTVSRSVLTKKFIRGSSSQCSDTESGLEAAEIQRILHVGREQKSFSGIGK